MASVARCAQDTDVCVVEGVMGLYDGRDGRSEHGSTAQLAKWLSAPVVLVLDCWSLARSAAALVAGFAAFDPGVQVAAVVFNKTGGEAHTAWLRDALDAAHAQPLPRQLEDRLRVPLPLRFALCEPLALPKRAALCLWHRLALAHAQRHGVRQRQRRAQQQRHALRHG